MKQTLGQIAIVTMGQSPSSEYYNTNRDGLPFLQGCTTFGRLYPTYDIWSSFYNKEAFPGDILFTVRAPVGDVNMCKDHIAIGRGLASIKAVNVLPKYLFYLLQANKHQFQFASSGTIYQSINRDKLLGVELNVRQIEDDEIIIETRTRAGRSYIELQQQNQTIKIIKEAQRAKRPNENAKRNDNDFFERFFATTLFFYLFFFF